MCSLMSINSCNIMEIPQTQLDLEDLETIAYIIELVNFEENVLAEKRK